MDIVKVLTDAVNKGASDVHIATGKKPCARIHGDVVLFDLPELTPEDAQKIVYEVIPQGSHEKFKQGEEVDCGFSIKDVGRFRVNVYQEKK